LTLPKLSIAAKLYAIFALMATTTVVLSAATIVGTRNNAALTAQLEAANRGSRNAERLNSLLAAMLEETRDTTTAQDLPVAATHAKELAELNDRIGGSLSEWQASMPDSDAAAVGHLAVRIEEFRTFVPELVRIASEQGPEAARKWVRNTIPTRSAKRSPTTSTR
jgi:methyl-accepting chemotaxis protein